MKKLLIRADDLGFCVSINLGILKTIECGAINNVGLMVNMEASRHGAECVREKNIAVGLHTNISVGKPILESTKIRSLVDDKGDFHKSKVFKKSISEIVDINDVVLEVEAQLKEFQRLMKRMPDYIDVHAVKSQNLYKAVSIIAKKYNILNASIDQNSLNPSQLGESMIYYYTGSLENKNIISDFINVIEKANRKLYIILITHPGYVDQYLLENSSLTIRRTLELDILCSDDFKKIIQRDDISLITYKDL